MTSNDLKNHILERIKKDGIKPVEKWKIDLASDAFWSGFVFLAVLSGLSLCALVYLLSEADWHFPHNAAIGRIEYILSVLPYFWIILLLVFLILSYYNLRNTKKGYRYEFKKIAGITFLIVVASGSIIYISSAHVAVDEVFFRRVPFYVRLANSKENVWNRPEKGLLGGMIIVSSPQTLEIEDFNGRQWKIISVNEAVVRPAVKLVPNEEIRIIGQALEQNTFDAREIRPWIGKARLIKRNPECGKAPGENKKRENQNR